VIEYGTYHDLTERWKALRGTRDIRVREVACIGAPRTLLCVEAGDYTSPLITISAGVHGDEPAGPLALVRAVEGDRLDPRFSYRLWACTNPTGFDARTRESIDGIDINRTFGRGGQSPEAKAMVMANRDFKFELAIDLHEDCDARAFYCYAYHASDVAARVIAVTGGEALAPDPQREAEELGGLSLSLLLVRNAAARVLTFETPGSQPLDVRIATHVRALEAAIEAVASL
jgi:predicted deacylase